MHSAPNMVVILARGRGRPAKKKRLPRRTAFLNGNCWQISALAGFEPALGLVDHVNAAFATHNAAITVPGLERAERVANFHVLLHLSVWREPAPGCGQPDTPEAVRPVKFGGGRYWDRTSDPFDVNEVLYR